MRHGESAPLFPPEDETQMAKTTESLPSGSSSSPEALVKPVGELLLSGQTAEAVDLDEQTAARQAREALESMQGNEAAQLRHERIGQELERQHERADRVKYAPKTEGEGPADSYQKRPLVINTNISKSPEQPHDVSSAQETQPELDSSVFLGGSYAPAQYAIAGVVFGALLALAALIIALYFY